MDGQIWQHYVKTVAATFAGALAAALVFIVAMNPYGNLPRLLPGRHVIMDSDQRFQYPSIARSGRYDSAVFGTSSGRLLSPDLLQQAFGGTFTNLALNDGRAWEQYQLAQLYLRHNPAPKTIVFTLDWVWCTDRAAVERTRPNEFPEWLYDENPWNDWQYVLNSRAIEISLRKLGYHLGFGKPRFPDNGFDVFVPPDATYDAPKAHAKIVAESRDAARVNAVPGAVDAASWQFPALAWLDDLFAKTPKSTRVLFAFMPAHVSVLPGAGSLERGRLDACKARVSELAARRGAPVVDFRFASPLTENYENFWDPLHYRLPIGGRIIAGMAAAQTRPAVDQEGIWRRLTPTPN